MRVLIAKGGKIANALLLGRGVFVGCILIMWLLMVQGVLRLRGARSEVRQPELGQLALGGLPVLHGGHALRGASAAQASSWRRWGH